LLFPETALAFDPFAGAAQWFLQQAAVMHAPLLPARYQASRFQHVEVFGDRWSRDRIRRPKFRDRAYPVRESGENA